MRATVARTMRMARPSEVLRKALHKPKDNLFNIQVLQVIGGSYVWFYFGECRPEARRDG